MKWNFITCRGIVLSLCLLLSSIMGRAVRLQAQRVVDPRLSSCRMEELAPGLSGIGAEERFVAELSSFQQYMAVAGHPSSYRLQVEGVPEAFRFGQSRLALHGVLHGLRHGFQRNVHASAGLSSSLQLSTTCNVAVALLYDIGYRYYRWEDVVTEHPFYADVPLNACFHTPTVSAGVSWLVAGGGMVGLAGSGSVRLPGQEFSASLTASFRRDLGDVGRDGRRAVMVEPYINYTYYSLDRTGHTLSAGCNGRIGPVHLRAFYRASDDIQRAGVGVGVDLGRHCRLEYMFLSPFRFSGVMAGVAVHDFSFRFAVSRKPARPILGVD